MKRIDFELVEALRKEKNLSREEFMKLCGYVISAYAHWKDRGGVLPRVWDHIQMKMKDIPRKEGPIEQDRIIESPRFTSLSIGQEITMDLPSDPRLRFNLFNSLRLIERRNPDRVYTIAPITLTFRREK